MDELRKVG